MAAIALVAIKFITRPNDIAGAYKEIVKDNLLIRTYGQIIWVLKVVNKAF